MCDACTFISRRRLLAGSAAMLSLVGARSGSAHANAPAGTALAPQEALEKLKAGNARFVATPNACVADLHNRRAALAKRQAPWATVIGCADSRVAPELLFGGLGLGELFIARNAGNLVDTATLGTVEYGAEHLGSPLIVVLGHERCGAVDAACKVAQTGVKLPGAIGPMVAPIVPIARSLQGRPGDLVDNTVRASARHTAAMLTRRSHILNHLVEQKKLEIVAAYYDLDEGTVEFMEPSLAVPAAATAHHDADRAPAKKRPARKVAARATPGSPSSWWSFLEH